MTPRCPACRIWRVWPNTPCPGCGHERHRKPKNPPTLADEVREWFATNGEKTAATAPPREKQAVKRIKTAPKQNNAVYGEIGDPFAVGE